MADQKDRVKAFFGAHADAYRKSASHRTGRDLEILRAELRPQRGDRLLDVATAAGHTAFALLPHVAQVTGVDLTPEMGRVFLREMEERGLRGARFVPGDVEALPFPDASFTLVTCRRAAHHFPDKDRAVGEMARVLAPGGRLGIVDMVPPSVPGADALVNGLERLRDASHGEAWTREAWEGSIGRHGCRILFSRVFAEDVPWDAWLAPVASTPDLRRAMAALLKEFPPEVRNQVVVEREGRNFFRKRRIILVATREGHP